LIGVEGFVALLLLIFPISLFYFFEENIFCLCRYPAEYFVVIGKAYGYFEMNISGDYKILRVLALLVVEVAVVGCMLFILFGQI
jgi:hypothetical protein